MEQEQNNQREMQAKAYENYVKTKTPVHNLWYNMGKAFLVGGIICVMGQFILNYCKKLGMDQEMSGNWCSMILILISIILTGLGLYQKLTNWAGAGSLVPITGFANSVASPAIEYKKEGQVFGVGCKIFTIAGPVILYGVFISWVLGILYWCGKCFGWV